MSGRVKELVKKYGGVAMAVHVSVSTASLCLCYVAIKNNVDVNDLLKRVGLLPSPEQPSGAKLPDGTVVEKIEKTTTPDGTVVEKIEKTTAPDGTVFEKIERTTEQDSEKLDHAAVKVLNEGSAFALAFMCNKALLPVRIPLTVVLTPPIARVWARARAFRRT